MFVVWLVILLRLADRSTGDSVVSQTDTPFLSLLMMTRMMMKDWKVPPMYMDTIMEEDGERERGGKKNRVEDRIPTLIRRR